MRRSITINAFVAAASALISGCQVTPVATTMTVSPDRHFEFHIDPWISLHHFAYHFVREEAHDLKLRGDVPLTDDDREAMSPEFQTSCSSLEIAYRPYIEGSLLFDKKTRNIAKELWNGPNALSDTVVRDALESCMSVYKETHWPSHRAMSQAFLDKLTAQLETHEEAMAFALAEALESSWPDIPIRVDITPYANWAGAYTDDLPPSLTLSSLDETTFEYAFEILFHEAAHTGEFGASLDAAADAALKQTGLGDPRFWHYILFFVTGKTVSMVLDDPDYVPYSRAVGLTERNSSAAFYTGLDKTWDQSDTLYERALLAARIAAKAQGQPTHSE